MDLITNKVFMNDEQGVQSLVHPFLSDHLDGIGIDLTVGDICRNVTKDDTIRLNGGQEFEVRRGDFVIIDTAEDLRVSDSYLGMVFPKVSLTLRGLSQSAGKVNPGFNGRLRIPLKNEGYETVKLKKGTRICNVVFWRIL